MEIEKVNLPVGYPISYKDVPGVVVAYYIREMTGYEEDIFMSRRIGAEEKVDMVLANTTIKVEFKSKDGVKEISDKDFISFVTKGLNPNDKLYLLVRLRVITYGRDYRFSYKCGSCDVKNDVIVNLDEIKPKKFNSEYRFLYELNLPSGLKATIQLPVGESAMKLAKIDDTDPDFMSKILSCIIAKIGDKNVTLQDIKALTLKDRRFVWNYYTEISGAIDNTIEAKCSACGELNQITVSLLTAEFLFPS